MPREAISLGPHDRVKVYASLGALAAVLLTGAVAFSIFVSFATPTVDTWIIVGSVEQFEVGQPVGFRDEKFWVVKQPNGSFVALYSKSTHLGCKVPWLPDFQFPDPATGEYRTAWFRDPCSGATWDVNGVRVFGPARSDLDRFPVEVRGHVVYVNDRISELIPGDSRPYWKR